MIFRRSDDSFAEHELTDDDLEFISGGGPDVGARPGAGSYPAGDRAPQSLLEDRSPGDPELWF
jgi:hypothetical protein